MADPLSGPVVKAPSDADLRRILKDTRTIALVGASPNRARASNFVMKYLLDRGYRVIPINPGQAGRELWGQTMRARLAEVDEPVQIINVFRNSAAAGDLVDEAIALKGAHGYDFIWMQLGVRNHSAAERAAAAGLEVIMDRCIKIDHGRLFRGRDWRQ